MAKGVGMDFLADTGALGRFSAGVPDDLRGNRMIGSVPAVAREQPDIGFTPQAPEVLAQGFEQIPAEHDIAIFAALAALDVDHVARTVDVGDLQAGQFGAPEACGIKRHQQSALERRGGGFDETVDFLPAEDGRQMNHLLWIGRQVRAPRLLQSLDVEETDSAEMLDNGVGLKLSFAEQIRLVMADVVRPELVGRAVEVAREFFNGTKIRAYRAGCVISTLEFLEHQLSEMGHRDLLVTAPYRDLSHAAHPDQCR